MSEEMKFKNEYHNTFNEVHTPEELSRKVMNMQKKEDNKTTTFFVRKLAAVAAIALVVLIGGNGIVYAATGNSLFSTVKVYFNGTEYEAKLEEKMDEDGDVYYKIGPFADEESTSMYTTGMTISNEAIEGTLEVIEEDGKIYIVDGELKQDITAEIKDGKTSGIYEKDGMTYEYEVTEKDGIWELNILGEYETGEYEIGE